MSALTASPDILLAIYDEQMRQADTARRVRQAHHATARPPVSHGRSWARFSSRARLNSRPV
jgi:hypothetical protein